VGSVMGGLCNGWALCRDPSWRSRVQSLGASLALVAQLPLGWHGMGRPGLGPCNILGSVTLGESFLPSRPQCIQLIEGHWCPHVKLSSLSGQSWEGQVPCSWS
jgi:hypothetical protein